MSGTLATLETLYRAHFQAQPRLPMWVIYRPTTPEYPGRWFARMHLALPKNQPTEFVITHPTLEALRDLLPPGLVNLGRDPADDPAIEEVWL